MARSLQELAQVKQIGEPAFAVHTFQQALVDRLLLPPALKHKSKPLLTPVIQVLLKTTAPVVDGLVIIAPRKNLISPQAHQFSCEGSKQQPLALAAIGWAQDRRKDALQFERLGARPHTGLRQFNARDPHLAERFPNCPALIMAAHQDGNIPRAQGAALNLDWCGEQSRDLGNGLADSPLLGVGALD